MHTSCCPGLCKCKQTQQSINEFLCLASFHLWASQHKQLWLKLILRVILNLRKNLSLWTVFIWSGMHRQGTGQAAVQPAVVEYPQIPRTVDSWCTWSRCMPVALRGWVFMLQGMGLSGGKSVRAGDNNPRWCRDLLGCTPRLPVAYSNGCAEDILSDAQDQLEEEW